MNEIYKGLGTKLEVSSAHQESIDLKGSFSTQDIKTGLLLFDIEKDSAPLPMSSLTATIYLKGDNFVVQDICEVNKELSQVSYVLNDETIKHFGSVQAEIYLRYNQGQSLSVHKFHFKIDQALIDQDLDVVYQVYFRDLEDIKTEYIQSFDNLDTELRQMIEGLRAEITTLESDSSALSTKLDTLEQKLIAMDALKKSGDTATGTINNTAESAFNVSCGYLRHYVGLQQAGTIVRIQIGTSSSKWGDYVDVTVGGTEVVINGDLRVNPISTSTTYATGLAPLTATWTKSIIGGVEKPASNTVTLKNLLEFGRNGETPFIRGNANFDGALTFDVANTSATPLFDLNNVTETQSWGRGLGARAGARLAEIGISGVGKVANSIYLGFDGSPWTKASGMFIEKATKKAFIFNEEMETTKGSQAKADKALTDATTKANTAETNSKAYTDSYFASKTILSNVAIYLSDTQSYTWNHANMKKGLYIEVVRYTVGTGSNDYGYFEIFVSKDFIERRLGKACWLPIPQSASGEKKAVKFAISGNVGTLTGYASNATSPDSAWAVSNLRID
ncbi:BppU family phage baseplate upper protein [Listeria booriae]|uniref:BppU family phage baseplate upper protein n=1 Tax=Listeria booriae TaxID=1552123 RepID=A0A841W5R2_9LIST|nr:BppU family phage baseplate upper protein [Listeria booriae]MBC1231483.1 BppU family phage baseplate upper protein [Listeria booriae]MBC1801131.1 BppU family phage baseplate upper protein [Listeria booriae]MBC2239748.1 BppU family phage baseplate upper protein [Listeria booriae]